MTGNEYKYWAFLCYSHQDNCEQRPDTRAVGRRCWGNWLYEALKTFSIPTELVGQINGWGEIIPERIDPIFRNEQELPEDDSLSAEICKALEQSICLIVICSPHSANSRQVNEAVRYFKQRGRGKHVFPIIIAGEPNASDGNKPGRTLEDECFVPAQRHPVSPDGTLDTTRRAGKSIFVDARHGVEKREILANDHLDAEADLEMAKIQLIALLLGVGFNGLWCREQKRHFFEFAAAQHEAREALNQVEEVRRQLQATQRQTREPQNQVQEKQILPGEVQGQIHEVQKHAQEAHYQVRAAQNQLQEFQNKIQETQSQLEEARHRAHTAESKILEVQHQARNTHSQLENTRHQVREAQAQVQEIQKQGRKARRLSKVFALVAVLAILATGQAWRQRKFANQAFLKAASEAAGKFDLVSGGLSQEQFRQMLQNIGGVEQAGNRRRSLNYLAAAIPREEIPEALKVASVIVDDQPRSHFQKWLLIRLGWFNPLSAMTSASAIEGRIVNDEGLVDSNRYFQLAVLDNWMKTDLPRASSWVCQLPDTDFRQCAQKKIFCWMQSQPDSDAKNKALELWIGELAKIDIPGALAMAESLPEGAWRSTVIAHCWMQTDPFAIWDWINSVDLPPEMMQLRVEPWPGTKFLLNTNLGDPTFFPVEAEIITKTANAPIQTMPKD